MIGDGCAANMSLCLGRRQQEEADRTASHTVTLLVAAGVFLAVAGSLFARQIVLLFGATETAFQASLGYTRIIVWGLPSCSLALPSRPLSGRTATPNTL